MVADAQLSFSLEYDIIQVLLQENPAKPFKFIRLLTLRGGF